MNIPSLTFVKRISLFALVILAMAVAASAQTVANVTDNQHCANGDRGTPIIPCEWQNGNLNDQNSQWSENEFVPMRILFAGLTIGQTYTVKISYDTTVGNDGKHAYDYLGTYDSTQANANPCDGIAGCNLIDDDNSTFPIPSDPRVNANMLTGRTQILGQEFTCFNCDILNVGTPGSEYGFTGSYSGASTTSIIVTFTANATNPVLSFAGHVGSRLDWGADNSAVAVSGSPYHWSVNDGPNRQMKVGPAGFPALLKIVKVVGTPGGATEINFGFDRTDDGVLDFTLQDDNDNDDGSPDNITFTYAVDAGATTTVNVTELPSFFGWKVTDINCVDASGGLSSIADSTPQLPGTPYVSGSTAVARLQNAEFVTCTFTNGLTVATAAPASVGGQVLSAYDRPLLGITVTLTDLASGEVRQTRTDSQGRYLFQNVETTKYYSLSVRGKRNTFPDNTIYFTLAQDSLDMNFRAAD